jgi:chromosomal replication initiation ATPase DnaA
MYIAHVHLRLSLSEVGRYFGRDRTTAAHACRTVEDRRDEEMIDRIIDRIGGAIDGWRKAMTQAVA